MLQAAAALLLVAAGGIEQWRVAEIVLTAARPHARPFHDVDVTATFTGPGGEQFARPAFWDGGDVWKIRFAPTRPGTWRWVTAANDPADTGLHGRTGSLECVPYAGELPIYRHGFLRVSDDQRHLAYRDGTPFFWLADTHWLWEGERLDESNRPGWPSQFRGMVDRRVAQGFTVYQVELFGRWLQQGPGSTAATPEAEPNLAHFQTNVDPKWQYLADHGVVVATTLGILDKDVTPERGAAEARMARYVCARYGAYPAAWLMYQECTANRSEQFRDEAQRQVYLNVVRAVGASYRQADAYHHPRTAHSDASLVTAFRGDVWLDLTLFQGGHSPIINRDRYYGFYFDQALTMPQIEGEACYEHLFEGSEANGSRTIPTESTREKAWQALQSGCAGYTYGANGVWQATWGGERGGNQTVYGNTPWQAGIDLPGGDQMRHLRAFYTALRWEQLLPRPECDGVLTWEAQLAAHLRPVVAADVGLDTVVVYFLRGAPFAATLHHLRQIAYQVRWYDPRSGRYRLVDDHLVPLDGDWRCPPMPDGEDWVLVLTSSARGAGPPVPSRWPAEAARRAAEEARNIAPRARVTASSTDLGNKVYDPRQAVDGNVDTADWRHWSNDPATDAPAAGRPAWLRLDWDAPVTFGKLVLYTMQGYELRDYAFEYLDGDTWRPVPGTDVKGNTEVLREHLLDQPITTRAVRLLCRRGPDNQPGIVRVVELQAVSE